ncbi:uncharacterized protein LOC134238618 [Saccostrea cucullata]|uniref:uncharacterized protein LOC134238618 n=1 Tax=Saccostrea cuccullata TaxID=36930 RepID=UPI002ED64039
MAADRLPLLLNNVGDDISDSESENELSIPIPYVVREEKANCLESGELISQSIQNEDYSEQRVLPLQADKKYHLFISYSSDDRDDANKICECMEQRFHMKCMNFERDFVPGKNIDDNIADNMRKSVKVLIILSPNYLQSHWCVTEAREAAQLSFTGFSDVNVIPLLLRPLGKDLPPFLKSYIYIDAQKEIDVPAKIYEAYLNPDSIDPLHKKRNVDNVAFQTYNGTFLCQKFASKAKFFDHGNSYRFHPLEDREKEKIASFDLSPMECTQHYNALMDDLNSRTLFRNYPLFVSKWRFLFLCGIIVIIVCICAGYDFIWWDDFRDIAIYLTIIGCCLVVLVCPCSLCFMYICRRNLSSSTYITVFRLNAKFYQNSKCLIVYDDSNVSKPTLNIFKYDTTECRNYVCLMLKKKKPIMNENDIKTSADALIERKLEDLQQRNGLLNWSSLPESASKRHRTRNDRACLCEMVEDSINKENKGIYTNRGTIEV